MMAFIIWAIIGLIFVGIGVIAFFSKKPMGFWANADMFQVSDTKKYNHTMGIMWCIFGVVFALLGLPLLAGENSPYIMLSVVGVMLEVIVFMVIYVLVIEKKYRK